jgi:plasmid stabilization system protein ParE
MARFILAERAKTDLYDIYDYIRQRSPTAAKRVRGELRAAMKKLAEFPGMGHRRDDVGDESLRFWSVLLLPHCLSSGHKTTADCPHHPRRARRSARAWAQMTVRRRERTQFVLRQATQSVSMKPDAPLDSLPSHWAYAQKRALVALWIARVTGLSSVLDQQDVHFIPIFRRDQRLEDF